MSDEEEIDGSIFDTTVTEGAPSLEVDTKEDVAVQLSQLQELVIEMKDAFTLAMGELSKIQYSDRLLEEKVEANNVENRKQVADVVQMVLSLKTEFSSVTTEIQAVSESQRTLQQQVENLQSEREVLLEELAKVGSGPDSLRHKYQSQKTPLNNEAQLSVLLEKAHGGFQTHISDHDSGVANCRPGDISSCGEATPPTGQPLSPMMQSYINGLHNSQDLPEEYDSDGSITAAANKSIDLSRTLHDKCLDIDDSISSEGEPNSAAPSRTPNGATDQGALRIESPVTTQVASPVQSPLTRKLAPHEQMIQDGQRLRVARELVETEKKFCSNLWTIIDFLVEAVKSSGTVSARDMSVLFPPSLPSLYELHSSLLLKMEERLASWKLQGILGDIFGRISDSNSDFFPLYQCYVNEFPAALEMIRKSAKHSQKFKKLVRDLQGHPASQGLDLGAYLLTPIQRPPRYVLLLKQMLKHTDRDHPDFYYLESTLNRLKTFLDQLNSSMETGVPMDQYSYKTKRKPPRAQSASAANGISSSCDGLDFSMTTRDSGVHSPDELSFMNSSNANAKSFYPSKTKVKPVQYDPHDVSSSSLEQSKKMFSSANQLNGAPKQSQGLAYSYGALTMPSRGERKKKKKQKQMQERTENYEASEHSDHHRYAPRSTPTPMDRRESPSVKLGHWNDEHFSRRIDSDSDTPARDLNSSRSEKGRYRQPIASDTSMEYDMYMDSFKNGEISAALSNRRDPFVAHSTPRGHHHSSPRHDFGIYGDEDNDVCDHSTYQPSIQTKGALTRRVPKLGISGRSKSQENIFDERNQTNPVPEPQNLSGRHFKSRPKSALSMPYIHSPSGQKLVERAWDDNNPRSNMSHDTSESSAWNDSVLNDSTSGNSTVLETSRRKESKKKRKERQRPNETLSRTSDSNRSKKRTTLRDSIKQIFTRKSDDQSELGSSDTFRLGSRVIELSDTSQTDYCNESLNASHSFPGENDHVRRKSSLGNLSQQRLTNEVPQRGLSNDASHVQRIRGNELHQRRMSSPLAVHSYELDENGDPCSAV